ncbi:hypothetical protein GJAV_G00248560 [Gymnothorax javanicus]|nr:hypothetical protein GJAV_G00248560 [Gymnothorax javanicus]
MANQKALERREKMEASSSDSEEDRMKEESRKNMKLVKKMSGKGEGEIEWQQDSDVQHKKWGGDFSFGNQSGLAIRGSLGYESRSEKKSVKGKAKFSF